VLIVLWDAFETIILPRRVTRKYRLTRLFYRYTWFFWKSAGSVFSSFRQKETYMAFYGPLSIILLLSVWALPSSFYAPLDTERKSYGQLADKRLGEKAGY